MPDPSSDFQFEARLENILAAIPTPTHSTESGPGPSEGTYDWEPNSLDSPVNIDGTIVGYKSELERQCTLDTWMSQLDTAGSQEIEHILNHSPLSPPNESHNVSGSMTINAPGTSDSAGSNRTTPVTSPLHTAAKRGHTKIVRLLLQHKAKCDIRDHEGLTPLIHATMGGYVDVVDLLLSHGASIGLADQQNRSALHWAVMSRLDRLLKLLLEKCTEGKSVIDGLTVEGRTPLQIAVETDFEAAVELLLESGADAQYKPRTTANEWLDDGGAVDGSLTRC